jgi:hypothetical protein
MVIWGGATTGAALATGARYDPSTNGWLATSTGQGVPSGRTYSTAVWTGREMIVWGGAPTTSTGGRYCACPAGALVYPDADGDGYGNASVPGASCDGSVPIGYVTDGADCDDSDTSRHPGVIEVCNGIDEDCDGQVDEDSEGEDTDHDGTRNLCDNCPLGFNPSQSDIDDDGEGDHCDLDDRMILILFNESDSTTSTH